MIRRRPAAGSTESLIGACMGAQGQDVVAVWVIGEDPGSRAVRAVAVSSDPSARWGEGFSVSDFWDFSRNPDKGLRSKGLVDAVYLAGVARGEAVECAADRVGALLSSCSWLIPGTDELVPGCWMEYDERRAPASNRTATEHEEIEK